jgi:hypothetical protein
MAELNLEQVTPLYALLLYTYMDATVLKGYRMPHLGAEEFPPLADYDYARNLKKRAFPVRPLMSIIPTDLQRLQ